MAERQRGECDPRTELLERLQDRETRRRIADALLTEASGGPPDPKSGIPKGGATVIRAFELVRELALEEEPDTAVDMPDLSRCDDAELCAMLSRLDGGPPPGGDG